MSRLVWILPLAVVLGACENTLDQRYLDASSSDSLVLPPDLAEYEVESRFELPKVFFGDDPNARNRVPVLANVRSMRLEGDADLYWLSVDESVTDLYRWVKNFWAWEGYRLTVDEPVIGVMQTEWILKEEGTVQQRGWLEKLFSGRDLSAVQDQFKTRIERIANGGSRVYIAHRGAEYNYRFESGEAATTAVVSNSGEDGNDNKWRFRQPEAELEIEMLSRLMVYLGLQRAQVEEQVENVKLFAPRAFWHIDSEENSPFLLLKDAYHVAWNRVYHQLERMNFKIESAEFKIGFGEKGVFIVNTETIEGERKSGLFSSSNAAQKRQIILVLNEESHELTRVNIETADGEIDTSPEGNQFLALLYQQIK